MKHLNMFLFKIKAVDLLNNLLVLEPEKRFDCVQALSHPFLRKYHLEEDEGTGVEMDDTIENKVYSLEQYKREYSLSFPILNFQNNQINKMPILYRSDQEQH